MKKLLLMSAAVLSLAVAGCATQSKGHGMACGKCACKMMKADAANPHKCKMCGHDAAEHNQAEGEKADHSKHH